MLVLQNITGPAEIYSQFRREERRGTGVKSLFSQSNQKKAEVPECKPDDLFVVHSRNEESSTLIYCKRKPKKKRHDKKWR